MDNILTFKLDEKKISTYSFTANKSHTCRILYFVLFKYLESFDDIMTTGYT